MEGLVHGFGEAFADAGRERDVFDRSLLEALNGPEVGEKDLFPFFADSGDVIEERFADAAVAQRAVIGEGEAVGFIANAPQHAEAG